MAETNELKPCPFCGGKGNASERTCDKDSQYNPNDRAYPVVRCSVCFTTVSGKDWSGISTAIEAWNKRATTTPPADAALADALESVALGDAMATKELMRQAAAALRARAVPECISQHDHRAVMSDSPIDFARGWNNCVAAMLAASKRGE